MTSRPVFPSSPTLTTIHVKQPKFPWQELKPGMSWVVKQNEVTYGTLKSMASRYGMKLGYKFRVIDHGEEGYEVGCLELTPEDIEFRKLKNKNNPEKEIKAVPDMSLATNRFPKD